MPTLRAYLRYSVDDGPTDSLKRQRNSIESCWNAGRYKLVYYEDPGISGLSVANRPGWQSLLADLGQPGDAGVIVESISRAFRSPKDGLNFYDDVLGPKGLTLISVTYGIDFSTTICGIFYE